MITFDSVSVSFPKIKTPILDRLSFHIPEGDLCLVIGRTGSGKTTLLRTINGLVPHFTGGTLQGTVKVAGLNTKHNRPRDLASLIGYVGQNPLASFVTDTVEDEIAYGMEQLGLSPLAMRKRVEETMDLLAIAPLRHRVLIELSGGQQQRVAIAAVLAAQPRILVLDEPTSALDPTAAQDVLAAITTLVHDVGLTLVLAEHRLERVMHMADSILWLPGDGNAELNSPSKVLRKSNIVPPLSQIANKMAWHTVPTSVREARRKVTKSSISITVTKELPHVKGDLLLEASNLTVSYDELIAVNHVKISCHSNEIIALMGRNGSGKSSLLWALQGALPSSGDIKVLGADPRKLTAHNARKLISLVPQQAADLLYLDSVSAELNQADKESEASPGSAAKILTDLGISLPSTRHPRDLSEGQRLALVLAIQLVSGPRLILLDEPTRGLDYSAKEDLIRIVRKLANNGNCVIISTHDIEFAANASDRTIILADGDIIADGSTREICTSSPATSPQVTKVFFPHKVLTINDLKIDTSSSKNEY